MVYHFLNPYNFVRTIQKARENLHILGNCPPPPHDRYVGLTGRIVCEVEAVTSLFISDSHAVKEDGRKHRTYRFFQYDGQPALPASSLRGMVRSVYEALTNSCFSIFQKDSLLNGDQEIRYPLEYRATQAQDMIPARVIDIREDGRACLEKLDCNINIPVKINESYPTIIKAGSVKKAYPPRVKLNNGSLFNASASKLPPDVYDGMRVAALVAKQPQLHKSKLFRAFEITNVRPVNEDGTFELNSDEGYVQIFGWLHITGPNIENKHDERLFFRWDDKKPDSPKQEEISSEYLYDCDPSVVEEYNHHLSAYWNRLKDTVEELNKKQKRWPKSNADMPQPSMFVEKNRTLQVGDLVYMQYDYNTKNQAVRLRPVAIPRLPYKHCREDFLPEHLKKRCELYDALCPACRLFGWVRENAGDANVDQLTACAGRLRFSHGTVKGNPIVEEKEIGLAILSTPKPTTTSFYLLDSKGKPNINVTYNNDDAQLRGRKMYRHHGVANSNEYERKDKDKQNRTIAGVLKPTTKFSFTIDFENLAPLEFGALLYALELEDDLVHRLGFAKPLGFGSVKVKVTEVKMVDWATRLSSIKQDAGWKPFDNVRQNEFKQLFLQEMHKLYGSEFDHLLDDLRSILGKPSDLPIHYPRPSITLDQEKYPQYKWFVGNKKRRDDKKGILPNPVYLDLASEDKTGLPLMDEKGLNVHR